MRELLDPLATSVILANLLLLACSRLRVGVTLAAVQGILLSLAPMALPQAEPNLQLAAFCVTALCVKGLIFPWMLIRTLQRVKARREMEPVLGYNLSVLTGIAGLVLAIWLRGQLGLTEALALPATAAFMTGITGFLLLIIRRKAITQVIGYLVAENGIFLFGTLVSAHAEIWVELSMLLDLFVAVFVMGIAIHNIGREFSSINTDRIASLKD